MKKPRVKGTYVRFETLYKIQFRRLAISNLTVIKIERDYTHIHSGSNGKFQLY